MPVGALRVERRREMTDFALGGVDEVHVESDRSTGVPRAAWVVVGLPTVETPVELFDHVPVEWTVARRVRCVCRSVVPRRRVTTLAAVPALRAESRRTEPSVSGHAETWRGDVSRNRCLGATFPDTNRLSVPV